MSRCDTHRFLISSDKRQRLVGECTFKYFWPLFIWPPVVTKWMKFVVRSLFLGSLFVKTSMLLMINRLDHIAPLSESYPTGFFFLHCLICRLIWSTNNLFKSAPISISQFSSSIATIQRSADDLELPYSPPKLSQMGNNFKSPHRQRNLLSSSTPNLNFGRRLSDSSDDTSAEGEDQHPLILFDSPSSSATGLSSSSSNLGLRRSRSRSPRARKKSFGNVMRFSFLSPPGSNDSSPSNSRSNSPTPDLSSSFGSLGRSLSVNSFLSREPKRRKFSPSSAISEQDWFIVRVLIRVSSIFPCDINF